MIAKVDNLQLNSDDTFQSLGTISATASSAEMSEEENSDNECEEDMLSSDEETENKVQATREMESQDSEADSVVSKM